MIQQIGERLIFWCNKCGRKAGGEYWTPIKTLPLGWIEKLGHHYCPTCALEILETPDQNTTIEDKNQEEITEQRVWISSSERIPGKKTQWVIGRSEKGKVYICRWSRSLEMWVDDKNREIEDKVTHWTYIPEFP